VHVLQSRVLLRPRDFARSVDFYERGIGLARYREWGEAPHRGVVYFLGGGYLELTEGGGASAAGLDSVPIRLWLQVADIESVRAELAERSITVAAEPEHKPWGLIEMSVLDPDGLELVVIETPVTHPLRRRD
jgi:catechol 2,3-dioxygenase-like lactoylglutathione lyase family enzyme